MTATGLMCLTLLSPAATSAESPWQRGRESTFVGTVTEAHNRSGGRFRRSHDLNVRVLVLERRGNSADVAVLTLLRRCDDVVSDAVGGVTGVDPSKTPTVPLTRLNLLRIDDNGAVVRLIPTGTPPLVLAEDTPLRAIPAVPLESFPAFEFGMFPPRTHGEGKSWTIASSDSQRPAEFWHHHSPEFVNAEQCAKLRMIQQSAEWDKPQAGQTSWQRTDSVWLSTLDGGVRQLHRAIVQRDGIDPSPAIRIEVNYALQGRSQIIGRAYDRCRTDIEMAYATARDCAAFLADPQRAERKWIDAKTKRLSQYLRDTEPGTPYREAVLAVLRRLEAVRRGDPAPEGPLPSH